MADKQETQVEATSTEEIQPESIETPLPTKEEYEATLKELEKAKSQANTFQGLLKDAQKKGISKDDLLSIYDRIDGQQRWIATAFDDIRKGFGSDYEEPVKGRKSYTEDAEEHITKAKESRQPPKDPAVDKFFEYLEEEGLVWEDDFVQDAAKDKSPQDALKSIKTKVKERNEAKLRDDLKKEIDDEKNRLREEILKDYGLTSTGPGGPSASRRDLSSMTPDEKLQEGFKKYSQKK